MAESGKDGRGVSNRVWFGLLAVLLVLGILGVLLVSLMRTEGAQVSITWRDQVPEVYPLSEDRTLLYEGDDEWNVVVIRDGKVFMQEASCPDQICVRHAPTDQTADPIVCLPNRLVVKILDPQADDELDGVS